MKPPAGSQLLTLHPAKGEAGSTMGKKLWSSLNRPVKDWMLVRVVEKDGKILVAEKSGLDGKMAVKQGMSPQNHGIVVAMGPGERNRDGELIPIDPEIQVGRTIIFMGGTKQRPDDFKAEMEAEGLWFVSAEAVISVLVAVPSFEPVHT